MFSMVLFVFYFVILLLAIYKITQKRIYNFSFGEVSSIFSFKILLGCLYGYIFLKYYHGDDTWNFFNDSLSEYNKLVNHPRVFVADFLPGPAFKNVQNFGEGLGFYISNLEYWIMIKLLAIFNIFSRGNYYIDVLFFNFATCWGPFLLFKLLLPIFPDKKNVLIISIFFIPSIGFWLSGIRGDSLIFLFMMFIIYYSSKFNEQKKNIYILWILAGSIGILIFRTPYLFILLPAYFCWIISKNKKRGAIYYFALIYSVYLLIFIGSIIISPGKNFLTPLVKQQASFFLLHGNTRFGLDTLKPTVTSFVQVLPQAFANTFVRPFFGEAKGSLQWIAAIEVVAIWILVGLLVIRPEKKSMKIFDEPLLLMLLFYSVSQILIIGYIVPFPGAIVRYKTIPELFLLILIFTSIDLKINYKKK
ncbi:MAG: hypothetical protein JST75_10375 [Bacteroidetes bacterium]|nr:hypothetical protein [Bacteroidota bacterium]